MQSGGPAGAVAPSLSLPPPSSIDALLNIHTLSISSDNLISSASSSSLPEETRSELEAINALAKELARAKFPSDVPPAPALGPNQRSALVQRAREEGNTAYKKGDYGTAITKYSISAQLAGTRPLYEASAYARYRLSYFIIIT